MANRLVPTVNFRSNCEIAIHVPDLDRAETFYAGVLGFQLLAKTPDHLEFDTGSLRLYVNLDAQTMRSFIPSLDVANFDAAKQHLTAAACPIVREDPGSRGLYFEDPFGLVWDVIERNNTNEPQLS